MSLHDRFFPKDRIDPFTLDEPWRRLMQNGLSARSHFKEAVRATSKGPTRDRLTTIGEAVDDTVNEAWQTAKAGHALAEAVRRLDVSGATRQLERTAVGPTETATTTESTTESMAERTAEASPSAGTDAVRGALTARVEAGGRMNEQIARAKDQLALLNARLDETVTRCIELSVGSYQPDEFNVVENNLADVAHELEAIRDALTTLPSPEAGHTQSSSG